MKFPYKFIDLTHTIENGIPTWDGTCGFKHDIDRDYKDSDSDTKFRVMKLEMDAGIGTHLDAPNHCIPGAASIHELTLDDLCMICVVIDVSHKAHEFYSVTPDDIFVFENTYGVIPECSCVIVKTGWERFWHAPDKYRNNLVFPSVSLEAANLLLRRGVKTLGIDTLSPDRPKDGYKVHQAFLGSGGVLIENAANIDKMPPVGGFVVAMPIKIKDATEAPIRLVGLIERE